MMMRLNRKSSKTKNKDKVCNRDGVAPFGVVDDVVVVAVVVAIGLSHGA